MTSSTRHNHGAPRTRRAARRAGFTLLELLVVIGIILVLVGLLLPSLAAVWKGSVRTRMTADLNAIAIALEAYKADHHEYPLVIGSGTTANHWGSVVLCKALVAPAPAANDGFDGPGFRARGGGKVYQAYLPSDKFKLVRPDGTQTTPTSGVDLNNCALGDRYGKPILYYPGNKTANIRVADGYVNDASYVGTTGTAGGGVRPMFNSNDNNGGPTAGLSEIQLRTLLGDRDNNGGINGGETAAYTGPYLLWSAGPDETFGPPNASQPVSPRNRCDDVANFPRTEY